MKLYVDDNRSLPEDEEDCVSSRTFEDAVWQLSIHDFDYVSLDFDLGRASTGNGLDILKWIAANGKEIAHINIHSSHPTGIRMMLDYARRHFENSLITTKALY